MVKQNKAIFCYIYISNRKWIALTKFSQQKRQLVKGNKCFCENTLKKFLVTFLSEKTHVYKRQNFTLLQNQKTRRLSLKIVCLPFQKLQWSYFYYNSF